MIIMIWRRGSKVAVMAASLALAALAFASVSRVNLVLFNHSPSIPTGFYVQAPGRVETGAIVTVRARDVAPVEASDRHYVGDGDRFIKRVAAVRGQTVCSDGHIVRIDGVDAAHVLVAPDRDVPHGWVGCRPLAANEILLLGDTPDSFDGRYWGPIDAHLVEAVWRPL